MNIFYRYIFKTIIFLIFFLAFFKNAFAHIDSPPPKRMDYLVLKNSENKEIEIRKYNKSKLISTNVMNSLERSFKTGIFVLGGYLLGDNKSYEKIQPLILPTIFETENSDNLKVETSEIKRKILIYLPQSYLSKNLPEPNNKEINTELSNGFLVASIKLSKITDNEIAISKKKLDNFLIKNDLIKKKIIVSQYKTGFFGASYELWYVLEQ